MARTVSRVRRRHVADQVTNVGFMLVIFSPALDLTNSLLMKIPVGRVNFLPLGAVRSIASSDILRAIEVK